MTQASQSQNLMQARTATIMSSAVDAQYVGGHLTARGRRLLATLALVPLVLAMVLTNSHKASATGTAPTTTQVVVHPGDSLWDIAVAIDPNVDPRKTMWDIQQLNSMETSRLVVGQSLIVPIR